MSHIDHRRLPAAAAGLLTACCTLHLILLAVGVCAAAAAAAGVSLAALGIVVVGAGLWWTARRRPRGGQVAEPAADSTHESVAVAVTGRPTTGTATRLAAATRRDHRVSRGAIESIDTPQPHSVRPIPGREGAHHV